MSNELQWVEHAYSRGHGCRKRILEFKTPSNERRGVPRPQLEVLKISPLLT